MPRRLCNKDKRKIYYAYKIGENNGKTQYTENSITCKGQFVRYNGYRTADISGVAISYTAKIIFEYNNSTKFIDEFTKIWVSYCPTNGNNSAEYKIAGLSYVVDGLFEVYLNMIKENNQDIWFCENDKIYRIEAEYNESENKIYIPKNMYCPIGYTTKIWITEPVNSDSTTDLFKITYIDEKSDTRKIFEIERVVI